MVQRQYLKAAALAAALSLLSIGPAAAHGAGWGQPQFYGWHMGPHMGAQMGPGTVLQGCPMGGGHGASGYGAMHPGMMGPGMMGPGMMGSGYGPDSADRQMMREGMPGRRMGPGMGQCMRGGVMGSGALDLTTEDVTRMLERRLAWQGNPHVKLGKVEEKDADTITAEIVTQDGSLVERLEVDRRSGWSWMVP